MATWRCPHCHTVQAESTRCFLCSRSATSCGTCTQFRSSVVGGLGYCALDRRREPLSGSEQRGCWTAADAAGQPQLFDVGPSMARERGADDLAPAPSIAARPVSGG